MRFLLGVGAVLMLEGCAAGLRDGVFVKEEVRYRVAAPDEARWRRLAFADADLAWGSTTSGHVVAVNATCHGHEDPPLDVLTSHLLFGFTDRQRLSSRRETIDGREALRSQYRAKLDGVAVELELVVLKKNGCVHDFTAVSPAGQQGGVRAVFDALVAGFAQVPRP